MRRAAAVRFAMLASALLLAGAGNTPARAAGEAAAVKSQEAATALLRGSFEQAITAYTEALDDQTLSNDRRAAILNDRGVAYSRSGNPKLALDDYNRAVQLFPEYAPIYNNRGNTLLALGLHQEAIKDFDRAITLAPGYAAAYNNRAAAQLAIGEPARAIKDYTRAVILMPQNAAPLNGRSRALLREDRPYAAMRDLARAISADAKSGAAYQLRAAALTDVGKYNEAIEDLSRAIAFEPNSLDLHIQRGHAYLMIDNAAAAIRDFTRALELDVRSASAFASRGFAHARAEAYEEAETDLAKALEINPRSTEAFTYRGWLYKQVGQPELGLKEVDKAMRTDSKNADVYWAKGEIEQALGRSNEAIASFRAALTLKPWHRSARTALQQMGIDPNPTTEVAGAAIPGWRVVHQAGSYTALLDGNARLRVPLEMVGKGEARLIDWQLRDGPLKGIGLLRYNAGVAAGEDGPEEVEQTAIVDLASNQVVSIQLHRQGEKESTWTWNEGAVTIASIDGVTETMQLRDTKPREVAQQRPLERQSDGSPIWAPWSQGWGTSPGYAQRGSQQQRQKKPKNFLDMLFGN